MAMGFEERQMALESALGRLVDQVNRVDLRLAQVQEQSDKVLKNGAAAAVEALGEASREVAGEHLEVLRGVISGLQGELRALADEPLKATREAAQAIRNDLQAESEKTRAVLRGSTEDAARVAAEFAKLLEVVNKGSSHAAGIASGLERIREQVSEHGLEVGEAVKEAQRKVKAELGGIEEQARKLLPRWWGLGVGLVPAGVVLASALLAIGASYQWAKVYVRSEERSQIREELKKSLNTRAIYYKAISTSDGGLTLQSWVLPNPIVVQPDGTYSPLKRRDDKWWYQGRSFDSLITSQTVEGKDVIVAN